MNFSTLSTIGQPPPQIRLPRAEWPVVGRTVHSLPGVPRGRELSFTFASRYWPQRITWSPELHALRFERAEVFRRLVRRRLYAEQHGKPLDAFPPRIRARRKRHAAQ